MIELFCCSICGASHDTELCVLHATLEIVNDTFTLSRARLTLPQGLFVNDKVDGSTAVIAKITFRMGVRFGPFKAKTSSTLNPNVNFPLKLFDVEEVWDGNEFTYSDVYLETDDEHTCNWMSLVAAASSVEEQNLFCFQEPVGNDPVAGDNAVQSTTDENQESRHDGSTLIKIKGGRPKRGRKRLFGDQSREERKKNKYKNETYFNYKKEEVKGKEFKNFVCNCIKKRQEVLPVEVRKQEYKNFCELASYDAQSLYLASCIKEVNKKRSYKEKKERENSKRQFTRIYTLHDTVVCREMFVQTFNVSTKQINTILTKLRNGNGVKDKRGLKQGGKNKLCNEKTEEVMNHIDRMPKYKSHYRRAQTDAEFLAPDMTLNKMYDCYKDEKAEQESKAKERGEYDDKIQKKCIPVSFSMYKKVFYTKFNLKFKCLKKDTCNKCDSFNVKYQNASTLEEKELISAEQIKHENDWIYAQKKMKEDMKTANESSVIECLSFDLEKTLPLPRIPTNLVFYKRQVWLYNCGVHTGSNNQGYCYVWVEGDAGRGAQEVASCLMRHVQEHLKDDIKELILWSDSCGGQNRNIRMVLMLKAMLGSHPTLTKITQRFLIPGHSFLPNDDDFGKIESLLNRHQRLYTPQDYINLMRDCRKKKPLIVHKMENQDFLCCSEIEKNIVNRKRGTNDESINWLQTREIIILKERPYHLFMKTQFDADPVEVDLRHRTRGRNIVQLSKEHLIPLWPEGKPVSEAKLKDIKSLLHLIPKDSLMFYKRLFASNTAVDDADCFGVPPDFEIIDSENDQ